jgi:hypothetical protein
MKKLFLFCLLNIFSLQLYGMDAPRDATDAERLLQLTQHRATSNNNHAELFPLHNKMLLRMHTLRDAKIACLFIGSGLILRIGGGFVWIVQPVAAWEQTAGKSLILMGSTYLICSLISHLKKQRKIKASEQAAFDCLSVHGWQGLLNSPIWKEHLKNVDCEPYRRHLNSINISDNNPDLPRLRARILASLPASHRA